jgi:hypothetical protein
MSKLIKIYFALAASLVTVYALVALLAFGGIPPYFFVYPPPVAVTLFLFLGPAGSVLGAICHGGLFLILNLYVLRRTVKQAPLKPLRAFMPSIVAICVLAGLSLPYWFGGWSYGMKYQGLLYVTIYGALNVLALSALVAVPFTIAHRASEDKQVITASTVMAYNWCIQVAILLVLFPYLGETP